MPAVATDAADPRATQDNTSEEASRTLIELTYAALRADIIEGSIAPGTKLRVEHLRLQYGVGAGTLREAMTRLVSDALVVTEGQRGFRVTHMTIAELNDITRVRIYLEIDSLRQSIRSATARWRDALTAAYHAVESEEPILPERRRHWEVLNTRFHEALLAGHDSPWTMRLLRLLARQSERYRCCAMALPEGLRKVHREHTEIYRFAVDGQDARAALALEAHIRAVPDLLTNAIREGRIFLPATAPS